MLLSACGGATHITGRIVDQQKKPVQKAEIETEPATDYLVTGRTGHFVINRHLDETNPTRFLELKDGKYTLKIRKTGYIPKEIPVLVEAGRHTNMGDVLLKRKTIKVDDLEDPDTNPNAGPGGGGLGQPIRGE